MSINALAFVFGRRLPATEKWTLVCLADAADDWGDSIFLSLDGLSEQTGYSRATLQRTLKALVDRGALTRVADSTPFSPPFYRIVGVVPPEGSRGPRRERECSGALRQAVLYSFQNRCEYCHQVGTDRAGPDGELWTIDRVVPGMAGGRYVPENVTLACRRCNSKKGRGSAPGGTRTLADLRTGGGPHGDTPTTAQVETPGASTCDPGGLTVTPDPSTDPGIDPVQAVALPPELDDRRRKEIPTQAQVVKLVHLLLDDHVQLRITDNFDLREHVKRACAHADYAYDGELVTRAIEAALASRGVKPWLPLESQWGHLVEGR